MLDAPQRVLVHEQQKATEGSLLKRGDDERQRSDRRNPWGNTTGPNDEGKQTNKTKAKQKTTHTHGIRGKQSKHYHRDTLSHNI